jgi:hypothetical protein
MLRSWVQIPPGPFLTVVQIRYCYELYFNNCRTKSLAMPIELYFTLQGDLRTSQTLQEALRDVSLL